MSAPPFYRRLEFINCVCRKTRLRRSGATLRDCKGRPRTEQSSSLDWTSKLQVAGNRSEPKCAKKGAVWASKG